MEASYIEQCQSYLDSDGKYTSEEWAAYESRITACGLVADDRVKEIHSLFFNNTKTMDSKWWMLKELESEVYLRIVTGQESIDYFDNFVLEWENQGGITISREVEELFNRDK